MAQFIIIDGPRQGGITPLGKSNTIGRSPGNSFVIDDATIAPRHARVDRKKGAFHISPVDPLSPVVVNGNPVKAEVLHHGDLVSLGEITLLFSDEPDPSLEDSTPTGETTAVIRSRVQHFQSVEEVISTFRSRKTLNEHLETLYRVGAVLSATLELSEVVEELLNIIFEVLEPDRAFVYLFEDRKKLELRGQRISSAGKQAGFTRVSNSILNETLSKKEGILTEDASRDQRFDLKQSILDQEIHSAICVPLIKKDRILGVIYLDQLSDSEPYRTDDLNLMNGIATQAALAIENVLHYHRTVRYSGTLVRLGQFSRKISSYLSRNIIIREAIEYACELFHCRRGTILLDKNGKLHVGWSTWIDQHLWGGIEPSLEDSLCGKVLSGNKPMLVDDSSGVEGTHPERHYESSSFLIVPIPARAEGINPGEKSIGVITLTDREGNGVFTRDDQEFLTVFAAQVGIALQNANLFERATVDTLTKLRTRQFFFAQAEEFVKAHAESGLALSLLMCDLDDFKKINDTRGHPVGDVVLEETGNRIRETIPAALTARYGGEEVVILLPGQNREKARMSGEKLRAAIADDPFPTDPPLSVSMSIGVGEVARGDTLADLVHKADFAMYEAKKAGKNRVVVYEGDAAPESVHRQRK